MANKYRHPKTPEWFCESKYERLSEYSSSQFLQLLFIRQELENVFWLRFSRLSERLEAFFNDPLSENNVFLKKGFSLEEEPFNPAAVIPADIVDIIHSNENRFCPIVKLQNGVSHRLKVGTIQNDNLAPLLIDLNATDKKIESEFKAWLKATKKSRKTGTRKVPSQGFEAEKIRIIEQKIFQFIDLKAWFKINNEKITDSEMARILFPYTKDAEHIKKTVRPNAERFLKFDYMSWLEHEKGNKKR